MTKTLQKRFVITAMAAVTMLLLLLLGIINIANAWYSSRETDRVLNMLSASEGPQHPRLPPDRRERHFFSPPPTEDTKMSAVYFTARKINPEGELTIDLSRISSISEAEAKELVQKVSSTDSAVGKTGVFKYMKSVSPIDGKETYTFLDTSSQRYSVLRMAALSCLTGLLVWALMLMLVILLSRRAILPIAKNIEKQKQFVTDAGHEIKTPLAIILANTEAMELHSGESKWSSNIKTQVSRLDGLMKDLLTLAKSDESNTDIPHEDVDLAKLISDCVDMFCESAALRGVMIESEIPPQLVFLSNKEYLTRLVSTLLDNAVKYAKSESSIKVCIYHTEKGTEILIRNDCETLPECEPEKLFDRFYRGDLARTQRSGGYGIGLSAARAMATALGGSLSAKYEKPNTILFTVKL